MKSDGKMIISSVYLIRSTNKEARVSIYQVRVLNTNMINEINTKNNHFVVLGCELMRIEVLIVMYYLLDYCYMIKKTKFFA